MSHAVFVSFLLHPAGFATAKHSSLSWSDHQTWQHRVRNNNIKIVTKEKKKKKKGKNVEGMKEILFMMFPFKFKMNDFTHFNELMIR